MFNRALWDVCAVLEAGRVSEPISKRYVTLQSHIEQWPPPLPDNALTSEK